MKLRILSVGCGWFEKGGIKNYFFDDAPSFSDYDAVVIDPNSISSLLLKKAKESSDGSLYTQLQSDGGFGNGLIKLMNKRIREFEILMENIGGLIIYFTREISKILNIREEERSITGYGGSWKTVRKMHIYSWLPPELFEQIYFRPSQGETVSEMKRTHSLFNYFDAFKNEISYRVIIDAGRVTPNIIAKNKAKEIISAEFSFKNGKIIFLPPLKNPNKDPKKLAGVLTSCIRKSLEWAPALIEPPWIDKYKLPNEEKVEEARKEVEGKKEKIKKEEDKLLERKNEIEMYKSLLYAQGKYVLEPSARKAFELIGFNVIPEEKYEEKYDLYIEEDNIIIIGEIEGSKNQIDVTKFRQLRHYVESEEDKTNKKDIKGLLIGNGLIDKEPEKRGEQFTEHAIKGCKRQNFCRITTFELFKAVERILQNPEDKNLKNSIKEKIINCNSEFKLRK